MSVSIRPVTEIDSIALARIYNHYITSTCITFETETVTSSEMSKRVNDIVDASLPWLVAENEDGVIGYAYASKWRARSAYRYSVESTVYLDSNCIGAGVGELLYKELLSAIRTASIHIVIGGIALPNERSIALHERLGFKKVAHFEQVGFKHDQWLDVGYWQLFL